MLAAGQRSELLRRVGAVPPWLDACSRQLEDLRNLYVEGALHIVLGIVARYRGLGVDSTDLIQEGNASLFQAIEGFDWRREVRFRTYAQYWVQQAVLKALYNSARTVRIPIWVQKLLGRIRRLQDEGRRAGREISNAEIGSRLGVSEQKVARVLATKRYSLSLDAQIGDDGGTMAQLLPDESLAAVPDQVREGDLRVSLDEIMVDLPDRERLILQRRFGLGGVEPETLGDIASDLGITAERVRQLQNAALNRLQQPVKKRRLAAFVESH
jgi:RNA polymerase primary sigma factor